MGWLSKLFADLTPSFEELRAMNRRSARQLSKKEARLRIEQHSVLGNPKANGQLVEILGLVDGRFDASARERCDVLLREAIAITGTLVRPGTVEEIWYLEGLFDRFLDP